MAWSKNSCNFFPNRKTKVIWKETFLGFQTLKYLMDCKIHGIYQNPLTVSRLIKCLTFTFFADRSWLDQKLKVRLVKRSRVSFHLDLTQGSISYKDKHLFLMLETPKLVFQAPKTNFQFHKHFWNFKQLKIQVQIYQNDH